MSRKNKMKNVALPKFILLVQLISQEILAQVRSERSIEILLRLAWIVDVGIQSI